ncbi:hypothetical protein [Paraburkholderia kururiensis]|uniref:hypothetical protein n=1 Tax=Paraburkholderia kururiensis TaxID=984307 RepID=UPI003132E3EE
MCDKHEPTTIADGYGRFPGRNGKAVAFHYYRHPCSCSLLSSLENVNIALARKIRHNLADARAHAIALDSGGQIAETHHLAHR